MKKTLKSMISAVMAIAMLGSTAVSISAYDVCPALELNDEEVEFYMEYMAALLRANGYDEDVIELSNSIWGDKDCPNPNNNKESTVIGDWYVKGEDIPDWIIGEYFERCDPDSEYYTERYKEAFEAVCNASGVTKEEFINNSSVRDRISIRDDVDFDGEVTIKDLTAVKRHLIKDSELTPVQRFALNDDISISVRDVARISKTLVGLNG